jgi:hypothetical protein
MRRSEKNQHLLRDFGVETAKLKAEVIESKGRVGKLASNLKEALAYKDAVEAKVVSSNEALRMEVQLHESLEARLAKVESLLETERQLTRKMAEDKRRLPGGTYLNKKL